MRCSNPPGIMSYTKPSSAIDCTRGIQNNQKTVSIKIEVMTTNSFIVWCVLAFVRWRLLTPVHLNIGVMRGATFFPVSPHFLTDKGIRIFTPNVATRADPAPSRQHLFHFHLRHLSLSEKSYTKCFRYYTPITPNYKDNRFIVCEISLQLIGQARKGIPASQERRQLGILWVCMPKLERERLLEVRIVCRRFQMVLPLSKK